MLEIYKIETLGCLDGPGVRTVFFLQGCPMKCCYCHNADSWLPMAGYGKEMPISHLLDIAMRNRSYYGVHGGVTLSGGEPLMQAETLLKLVKLLKSNGIHVVLDTSGSIINEETKAVIKLVDLVILDIKANNDLQYKMLTGHSMKKPMKTLEFIQSIRKPYWIRQVALPGINDSETNFNELMEITKHPSRQHIEQLEYHSMGQEKWEDWQNKWRYSPKNT